MLMYEKIQEQFNAVITYSQNILEPNTDELFEDWFKAKRHFIDIFDGRLIVEVPVKVSFTLDEKAKTEKLNDFIEEVYTTYNNEPLGEFLEREAAGFYSNTVVEDYYFETDTKQGTVSKGMKLLRAFKFFEEDEKTLKNIQDSASRVIQENKIEGTLCFSVHPLDYLSSSQNTYNWRSCHSLDGEYRAGNLSYMVDNHTIMCYLKGADDVEIPMFPQSVRWNNKKWRMLLFFSDNMDMIFAGRQYPFTSTPGLNIVLDELRRIMNLSETASFSQWDNRYATYENTSLPIDFNYIPVRGELLKLNDIIKDHRHALNYNDLLRSSCYTSPYYSIRDNYAWCRWQYTMPSFTIGGEVTCLQCGNHTITNPETMRCDSCELEYGYEDNDVYGTCDCCGARLIRDDSVWVGDDIVCDSCYDNACFICECCDEVNYNSDKIYDKRRDAFVCSSCYEDYEEDED